MPRTRISLDQAVELTRTGDIWVFRGRTVADRAIQLTTNSPVNHVGMSVVIEDLPPLMWHAELGRSLLDVWSGTHRRGVQLHDLRQAVLTWGHRYGQRAWLRQLEPPATREMEDAVLRTVARLDGTPFPSTARLAGRWLRGRVPRLRLPFREADRPQAEERGREAGERAPRLGARLRRVTRLGRRAERAPEAAEPGKPAGEAGRAGERTLETAYCAEVVAVTYEEMGLLAPGRRVNWYDPGRFWSGDDLELLGGARLGGEIAVELPPA